MAREQEQSDRELRESGNDTDASAADRAPARSTTTPANGSSATRASMPQIKMMASPADERVAVTTASASAAGVIASPSASTTRPANRMPKSLSRRGEATPRR